MEIKIAKRLAKCRNRTGLSVVEAANMLGVKPSELEGWENGQGEPASNVLLTMSKLYGVALDVMLDPEQKLPEPNMTTEERVRKMLDDIEADIQYDKERFVYKFPLPVFFVAAYLIVSLTSGFFGQNLWFGWALVFLAPVPIWYIYVLIHWLRSRAKSGHSAGDDTKQEG